MSLSMAIKKRYPGFTLDVVLEAGEERVALLGASGCGKSLTLRCIAGVETPDEGRIVVNGVTFFDSEAGVSLSPQERKTALLFQNYQLFPHMTVLENVCAGMAGPWLGLGGRMDGEAARRESRALRFLEIFGVSAFADRFPTQLSGGQQQRVAIGRALMNAPSVVLADEPTGNLDSKNSAEIMSLLRASNKKFKQTLIVITHDEDVALMADRVIAIEDGRIVRDERRA